MEPLYTAVIHGCRAGRQQEVFEEVYWRRIQRGDEFFNIFKLGAYASDLSALSGFFERPWDQPSTNLSSKYHASLFSEAGFRLRALGRLTEAVQPMEAGLEAAIRLEDWKNAPVDANNLSELILTLGDVSRAVFFGKQSVDLGGRSDNDFNRLFTRTTLANALHQSGHWEESAEFFREAEALQVTKWPEHRGLFSLRGYQYCDLLLSRGEPESGWFLDVPIASLELVGQLRKACQEVLDRAELTLRWSTARRFLLDIALDHLSLGRAHLGIALMSPGKEAEEEFVKAAEYLDHAVEGLRRASREDYLPRGLLARSSLQRLQGDLAGAETDLSEALEIAERGSMRLHECDAHLEWTRLCRQRGETEEAKRHLEVARRIVEETGYGRRRREVGWLERQLA